jgi:hypothetical protein
MFVAQFVFSLMILNGFCVLESTISFLKLEGIPSVCDGKFSFVCFQKVKIFSQLMRLRLQTLQTIFEMEISFVEL